MLDESRRLLFEDFKSVSWSMKDMVKERAWQRSTRTNQVKYEWRSCHCWRDNGGQSRYRAENEGGHKESRIVRPTWLNQVMGKKGARNGGQKRETTRRTWKRKECDDGGGRAWARGRERLAGSQHSNSERLKGSHDAKGTKPVVDACGSGTSPACPNKVIS